MRSGLTLVVGVLCLSQVASAAAVVSDLSGNLWDIDLESGQVSNMRAGGQTSASYVGLARSGEKLYTVQTWHGPNPNALLEVNEATAALAVIGLMGLTSGLGISEGDLAIDLATGVLYGTSHKPAASQNQLFTVDLTTGAGTIVGALPGDTDHSGMAFDGNGDLFVLDNAGKTLLKVNKSTAAVVSSVSLDIGGANMGDVCGMDFDPVSGQMYLVAGIMPSLYRLDTESGQATLIGSTGLGFGNSLAGLVVPEPATLVLLAIGGLGLLRRKRGYGA